MKKKENRGGKRKGAGRKKLAPTKTVSFRVKVEDVEGVKNAVSEFLAGKKIKKKMRHNSLIADTNPPNKPPFRPIGERVLRKYKRAKPQQTAKDRNGIALNLTVPIVNALELLDARKLQYDTSEQKQASSRNAKLGNQK
jgi:hypothetical protein